MNYYEILGVKRDATQAEIRKKYKSLIKKYHPDLNQDDKSYAEKRTMEINLAYDTLSNPELREEYDLELEAENQQSYSNVINNIRTQNQNSTQEQQNSYYNDELFNKIYQSYNKRKNDYIFHKHYKQNNSYYTNNDAYNDYLNNKINQAEKYVENSISKLKIRQQIILFFIMLIVFTILFLTSMHQFSTFINNQNKSISQPSTNTIKNNVKNTIKNNIESYANYSIKNSASNDLAISNSDTNINIYGNSTPPSSSESSSTSIFQGTNIDENILDKLDKKTLYELDTYYDYFTKYLNKSGIFSSFTDRELKTILYYYIFEPNEYQKWINSLNE